MSHRKFEAPRHGSMAFSPRKRCKRSKAKIKSFPADDPTKPVHLTAFIGYKAGMTHIVRELDRPGSKMNKKEIMEPVTIIETPKMIVVGVVGYAETPTGLQTIATVWAEHLSDGVKRRLLQTSFRKRKDTVLSEYYKKYLDEKTGINSLLEKLRDNAKVIRVLAHTEPHKIKSLKLKKAHLLEIQLNGGTIEEKIEWAYSHFEQAIGVSDVFAQNELMDIVGITKGKGFQTVTTRWGTKLLQRKANKGIRKVACIGAWHPANVMFTVPRAGQTGFHQRTELNKKIYLLGNGSDPNSATTKYDITKKSISPMGGFPHYGPIRHDFVMVKGCCMGADRRCVTLRKAFAPSKDSSKAENIELKFIDTSSKIGCGRFQTSEEKAAFMGATKKTIS